MSALTGRACGAFGIRSRRSWPVTSTQGCLRTAKRTRRTYWCLVSPSRRKDASLDMVLMDYVVEHLTNPQETFMEISRILKPGGWLCCRTPNRNYYVSIISRLMPSRLQKQLVSAAQPGRKPEDIFQTAYLANSASALKKLLPAPRFSTYIYYYHPEPAYHFGKKWLLAVMVTLERWMPSSIYARIFLSLPGKKSKRFSPNV